MEIVRVDTEATLEHELYLHTEGATRAIGTLLVVDRLPREPIVDSVLDSHLGLRLVADVPRPN